VLPFWYFGNDLVSYTKSGILPKTGYDLSYFSFLVSSFFIMFYQGTLVSSTSGEQVNDTVQAVNIS